MQRNGSGFKGPEEGLIAILRANAMEAREATLLDVRECDVARRYDVVPRRSRYVAAFKHIGNAMLRYRRVRHENDSAAAGAEFFERPASTLECRNAVMHDAPDVAEDDIVAL